MIMTIYYSALLVILVSTVRGDVDDLTLLKKTLLEEYSVTTIPLNKNGFTPLNMSTPVITNAVMDENAEQITIDLWLRMEWEDIRLIWDPKEYRGHEEVHFSSKDIWTPDLSVYNHHPAFEIASHISRTNAIAYSRGKVLWVPTTTSSVPCEHHTANWPFDTMLCQITVGSWTYSGKMLPLTYKPLEYANITEYYVANSEWQITDVTSALNGKEYPCCPGTVYYAIEMNLTVNRIAPMKGLFLLFTLVLVIVKLVSVRFLFYKDQSKFYLTASPQFVISSFFMLLAECCLLVGLYAVIPSAASLPHLVSFVIFLVCVEVIGFTFMGLSQKYYAN